MMIFLERSRMTCNDMEKIKTNIENLCRRVKVYREEYDRIAEEINRLEKRQSFMNDRIAIYDEKNWAAVQI